MSDLVSRVEAARILSVDKRTITRYMEKGYLSGFRLPSGNWRVTKESIDQLVKGNTNGND